MTFKKYLESKIKNDITIKIDDYKSKLVAEVSSLLLKPKQFHENCKEIINIRNVISILSELNYPLKNEMAIALRTGDAKKINRAHAVFSKWVNYGNPNSTLVNQIENTIFRYQTNLHRQEFSSDDIDQIIDSSLTESQRILEHIAKRIQSISPTQKVIIEAIFPENGWIVSEAKISIGESYQGSFICEQTTTGFKTRDISKNNLPDSTKNEFEKIINQFNEKKKENKILILYLKRPVLERKYYEHIKRDLSLGIEAVLPDYVHLSNLILKEDELDIWKIRIEEKYLYEYIVEGDFKEYKILFEEAPIRWIERVENEKQH